MLDVFRVGPILIITYLPINADAPVLCFLCDFFCTITQLIFATVFRLHGAGPHDQFQEIQLFL